MANRITFLFAAAALVVAATISSIFVAVWKRRVGDSPESPVLNTANVLLTHQEGTICLQGRTLQSRTVSPDEPDVVVVQEVIDGLMHMYEMVNIDELYTEDRKDLSWIDTLVGVKYNCQVSPIDDDGGSDFDTSEPTLLRRNNDGSTSWAIAHWTIEAGADLVPRILRSPDDDPHDTEDTSFELNIDKVADCSGVLIVGCDPATEAGDDHLPSGNLTEDMVEDSLRAHGHDVDGDGTRRLIQRLLQWQFVPDITGTNWCGPRTPKDATPCPNDALPNSNYDKRADIACRRHDHGVKFKVGAGAGDLPRTECMNDRDLVYASDNWALEAVYGWAGVAGTWGCYSYGPYNCWKRWRYGKYCCGEKVRYGWTRYNNIARYDHWGYYPPDVSKGEQFCDNDLWKCVGNDCTALTPRAPETATQCA